MTSEKRASTNRTDSALRMIGDLDHPFYNDERHRFVWYESAAIGFQLVLILQYTVAGLLMLIFGRSAMPWVLAMLAPLILAVVVVEGYSRRHNAPYMAKASDFARGRGRLAIGMGLLYLLGALRAVFDSEVPFGSGDSAGGYEEVLGFVVGMTAAVVVGVAIVLLWRRYIQPGDAKEPLETIRDGD